MLLPNWIRSGCRKYSIVTFWIVNPWKIFFVEQLFTLNFTIIITIMILYCKLSVIFINSEKFLRYCIKYFIQTNISPKWYSDSNNGRQSQWVSPAAPALLGIITFCRVFYFPLIRCFPYTPYWLLNYLSQIPHFSLSSDFQLCSVFAGVERGGGGNTQAGDGRPLYNRISFVDQQLHTRPGTLNEGWTPYNVNLQYQHFLFGKHFNGIPLRVRQHQPQVVDPMSTYIFIRAFKCYRKLSDQNEQNIFNGEFLHRNQLWNER